VRRAIVFPSQFFKPRLGKMLAAMTYGLSDSVNEILDGFTRNLCGFDQAVQHSNHFSKSKYCTVRCGCSYRQEVYRLRIKQEKKR
jgi:hypothetical protein